MQHIRFALAGLVAVSTAVLAEPAGATLKVETTGGSTSPTLVITDTTGDANTVSVKAIEPASGPKWLISQGGSLDFELGAGCSIPTSRPVPRAGSTRNVAPNSASCTRPGTKKGTVLPSLGPKDDTLTVKGPDGTAAAFADRVQAVGGDGNDVLNGGAGNDQLDGGTGNDQLRGEDGNDGLLAGDGLDVLQGGPGDDNLHEMGGGGSTGDLQLDSYEGGAGFDTVSYRGPRVITSGRIDDSFAGHDANLDGVVDPPGDHVSGLERVVGSDAGDALSLAADSRDGLTLNGGRGRDSLIGGGGDDVLQGDGIVCGACVTPGDSGDSIFGRAGDDQLVSGPGPDALRGEGGNDVLDGKIGDDATGTPSANAESRDDFDCGSGTNDRAVLSLLDSLSSVTGCETIEQSDVRERYHPRLGPRRGAVVLVEGKAGVPIDCPRKQHRACAGRLSLALTDAGTTNPAPTRYRVGAGHVKVVNARLSATEVHAVHDAPRGVAAIAVAQETSAIGKPKTTIERLAVRD